MKITKSQALIFRFILILNCFLMISCNSSTKQYNQVFMPNDSLALEVDTLINLESLGILVPDLIRCMDSSIIIFEDVPTECIKVISSQTGKLTASFLNKGHASYEVIDVANIDCYMGQNGSCVNVMELNGNHNKSYLLSQPNTLTYVCEYDKNLQSAIMINDRLTVASSIFDSVRFYLFDGNGQILDSLRLFPPMPENVNNIMTHSIACSGNIRKNPQGNLIVSRVIYDGGIDVVEIQNGEKLKHKWSFRAFPMVYNTIEMNGYLMPTPSKESKMGYLDVTLSCKYI